MAEFTFDATTVEVRDDYEALPPGEYPVVITDSYWKDTKSGTGRYLELKLQVVGNSHHSGRVVFDRLNLDNPNETAVKIAYETLARICQALRIEKMTNSEQLHGIELIAKVATKEYNGGLSNEVKGYKGKETGGASVQPGSGFSDNSAAPPSRPGWMA